MWKTGYSIFMFGYGGTVYNASRFLDNLENNFFEIEEDAWKFIDLASDKEERLVYTVMRVAKFTEEN